MEIMQHLEIRNLMLHSHITKNLIRSAFSRLLQKIVLEKISMTAITRASNAAPDGPCSNKFYFQFSFYLDMLNNASYLAS